MTMCNVQLAMSKYIMIANKMKKSAKCRKNDTLRIFYCPLKFNHCTLHIAHCSLLIANCSADWLKVGRTVLAEGTNEVIGQLLALINITAYFAYPAFFAIGLGLGLNVVLIVCVSHSFFIGKYSRLCNTAYKHTVGIHVNVLLDFEGHE